MFKRRATHQMSNDRFANWFAAFCRPYTQERFIYSYKALENAYSELIIKHMLTAQQRRQVNRFISKLPKMNRKRFRNFLRELRKDSSILYRYSYKDFTPRQQLIIKYYLFKELLTVHFSNIGGY